jgi:hypothetical protein
VFKFLMIFPVIPVVMIFDKVKFTLQIEILSFFTPTEDFAGRTHITPAFAFLLSSPVWKQAGKPLRLLGEQGGEIKLAGLLSPWQPADPIFSGPGEAEFTSRKRRVDASQLLKGQSEDFLTSRRITSEAHGNRHMHI